VTLPAAPSQVPAATIRDYFALDPGLAYLNHGGFGACPIPVLDARRRAGERIEADPSGFYRHRVAQELADALVPVADTLGARPADLAWVPNTTFGLNLVARSLLGRLGPGDEVLVTDLEYGSQVMLWRWLCDRAGARLRIAPVAEASGDAVAAVIEGCVSAGTRVALVSHITSSTARRLPVEAISRRLRERGVVVVVDGAHAPGHIPLDLEAVGADYYVGNLHKWFAAPRGAAVLHAPGAEAQRALDPLVVSWGGTDPATPLGERIHSPGTVDPTTYLAAPDGVAWHREVLAPARPAARARLAAAAGKLAELGLERVGSHDDDLMMAAFWLPDGAARAGVGGGGAGIDPARLEAALARARIEAVVTEHAGRSMLRICVSWYTTDDEVDRLVEVLDARTLPLR
jgi:isopenicillin-N epimerase